MAARRGNVKLLMVPFKIICATSHSINYLTVLRKLRGARFRANPFEKKRESPRATGSYPWNYCTIDHKGEGTWGDQITLNWTNFVIAEWVIYNTELWKKKTVIVFYCWVIDWNVEKWRKKLWKGARNRGNCCTIYNKGREKEHWKTLSQIAQIKFCSSRMCAVYNSALVKEEQV